MTADAPQTLQTQATGVGRFNATAFLVAQLIGQANVATMVRVVNVYPPEDPLGGTGTLDVQPLVNQLAADGTPVEHGTVYGLIYARLQGGSSAVVLDPQPDDIGVAVICDKDISSVKQALGPANPGSWRRNSYSDGVYLLGWGNAAPTQYVQFLAGGGIKVVAPAGINLNGVQIDGSGNLAGPGTVTAAGEVTAKFGTADFVTLTGHNQPVVGSTAEAPTPGI